RFRWGALILPELCLPRAPSPFLGLSFRGKPDHFYRKILALSQKKQNRVLEGDIYNEFTGQWEQVKLDSKGIDRSQIAKTNNSDGLHNYAVLKGYFDQYDEESQTLKLRAAIAKRRRQRSGLCGCRDAVCDGIDHAG
ncbi:MAG: hypothetical protein RBS45_03545, partial [Anaerolineales bacterium]|nr:hypothetical protein [Anaerolineales bacterium]